MPFKSKAQQKWMFANDPAMAKRWAKETPSMKDLPDKKGSKKKSSRAKRGEMKKFKKASIKKGKKFASPKSKMKPPNSITMLGKLSA